MAPRSRFSRDVCHEGPAIHPVCSSTSSSLQARATWDSSTVRKRLRVLTVAGTRRVKVEEPSARHKDSLSESQIAHCTRRNGSVQW